MPNPFTAIETAFIDAGKFITDIESKVERLFAKEQKVAPTVAAALVKTVADVQALIALGASAASASGLNFPVDSAAFAQFLVVKNDVVSLSAELIAAEKAL